MLSRGRQNHQAVEGSEEVSDLNITMGLLGLGPLAAVFNPDESDTKQYYPKKNNDRKNKRVKVGKGKRGKK